MGVIDLTKPIPHAEIESMFRAASGHAAGRSTRDAYFQGDVMLEKLGIRIPRELDIFRTVLNFGKINIEAQLDRANLEGFRCGATRADTAASSIYRRNNLAEELYLVEQEALSQKRAYLIVGTDTDGKALITSHTAVGIHAEHDPITRTVRWAFQTWGDGKKRPREATLYTPGLNIDFTKTGRTWSEKPDGRRPTGLNETAVIAVVNRTALGDFRGRSELDVTNKWTDAGARTLTNLQIAGESLALPHRSFFGVEDDSQPETEIDRLKAYLSKTSFFANPDGKAIQLPGADLRGFIEVVQMYCRSVAAQTGLPLDYLGLSSDNPSSAEAITRGEARLIKKVRRKIALFSEAFERAMRLALQIEGITDATVEAVWEAPETPNLAGTTDSVVKLRAPGPDGKPLISADTGRRMLGMSPEAREREANAVDKEFHGLAVSEGWAA